MKTASVKLICLLLCLALWLCGCSATPKTPAAPEQSSVSDTGQITEPQSIEGIATELQTNTTEPQANATQNTEPYSVQTAMGRYVEKQVTTPSGPWVAFAQTNGTIFAVDRSGSRIMHSSNINNNDWDVLDSGHDEQTSPAQDGINGLAVASDGTIYLSSGWAMVNEDRLPYIECIQDGMARRVQLDQELSTGGDWLLLCAPASGGLIALSDVEAYRFSSEGKTVQRYAVPGGVSVASYKNEVAICSLTNGIIAVLDIETGQALRTLPLPGAPGNCAIGYDMNGALYYVCADGLYQVNAASTMMVQIADGRLMTASKPSAEACAILFDSQNNPIIAYRQNGGITLIAYSYDENVPTEPNNLLSVYALYDSQTLREGINQFQQAHPDIMVDVTVVLPKGTAITRDDAIRTLNTEMLTGNGPDVLILDGLPIQNYIDQGMLMDISSIIQPMIDSGEIQSNITSAFMRNGTICAVPTSFFIPTLWGEVAGLNALEDMAVWAQANPGSVPLYAVEPEFLIGTFYFSCAPAWFNDQGQLDDGKMRDFLTEVKKLRGNWSYEAVAQATGQDYQARLSGNGQIQEWNPYSGSHDRSIGAEYMGADSMMRGYQKQLPCLLRGKNRVSQVNGQMIASDLSSKGFAPLPGQAEGCFAPTQILGINRATPNSTVALSFVQFMLGQSAQNTLMNGSSGFPVNAEVLDSMFIPETSSEGSMSGSGGVGVYSVDTWLNEKQCGQMRDMMNGLHNPVMIDFTLFQMIVNESIAFFDERIDANQAAQSICAKVNAYLTE